MVTGLLSGCSSAAFRGLMEFKRTTERQPVKPREPSLSRSGSKSSDPEERCRKAVRSGGRSACRGRRVVGGRQVRLRPLRTAVDRLSPSDMDELLITSPTVKAPNLEFRPQTSASVTLFILTVDFSQNQGLYAVEFSVPRQVEVFSGVLIDLEQPPHFFHVYSPDKRSETLGTHQQRSLA